MTIFYTIFDLLIYIKLYIWAYRGAVKCVIGRYQFSRDETPELEDKI
jgi:hypothetical protein